MQTCKTLSFVLKKELQIHCRYWIVVFTADTGLRCSASANPTDSSGKTAETRDKEFFSYDNGET